MVINLEQSSELRILLNHVEASHRLHHCVHAFARWSFFAVYCLSESFVHAAFEHICTVVLALQPAEDVQDSLKAEFHVPLLTELTYKEPEPAFGFD